MNATILFPSDYFASDVVDETYAAEYEAVKAIDGLGAVLFNYDAFIEGLPLKLNAADGNCLESVIYRGWMMKPEDYRRFYRELANLGFRLLTTPACYEKTHCFPNVVTALSGQTPKILVFPEVDGSVDVDADVVNRTFERFMVKDYVKSVKGTAFPTSIETPIDQSSLDGLIQQFIKLREPLFTGGIVLKEYVNLKRYDGHTNEWREFLFGNSERLSLAKNSNQPSSCPSPPDDYLESRNKLDCPFYTLDHAELADGSWTIIETGDGQVSGLAKSEDPITFYQAIASRQNLI